MEAKGGRGRRKQCRALKQRQTWLQPWTVPRLDAFMQKCGVGCWWSSQLGVDMVGYGVGTKDEWEEGAPRLFWKGQALQLHG